MTHELRVTNDNSSNVGKRHERKVSLWCGSPTCDTAVTIFVASYDKEFVESDAVVDHAKATHRAMCHPEREPAPLTSPGE